MGGHRPRGNLAKIAEHGRRADGIVKSMLAQSRGGTGDWQSSSIKGLVEEALNLAYHGARAQDQSFNVVLERDFGEALKPIDMVPQDVTRVFLNLFSNGFYATRKRQRDKGGDGYQPTLKVSTRDLGEVVEIHVLRHPGRQWRHCKTFWAWSDSQFRCRRTCNMEKRRV